MVLKLSIDHYTVVFSPVEKMQGGSRSDYFKKNWVGSVHVELGNVKKKLSHFLLLPTLFKADKLADCTKFRIRTSL